MSSPVFPLGPQQELDAAEGELIPDSQGSYIPPRGKRSSPVTIPTISIPFKIIMPRDAVWADCRSRSKKEKSKKKSKESREAKSKYMVIVESTQTQPEIEQFAREELVGESICRLDSDT